MRIARTTANIVNVFQGEKTGEVDEQDNGFEDGVKASNGESPLHARGEIPRD